jgi:hypothetical protein
VGAQTRRSWRARSDQIDLRARGARGAASDGEAIHDRGPARRLVALLDVPDFPAPA